MNQSGLARSRLPGDGNEPLTLGDRIFQIGLRIRVTGVIEGKAMVRTQPERVVLKLVTGLVYVEHLLITPSQCPRLCTRWLITLNGLI